jgi:L-lactate dehydrogenase complex protein LldG
MSERENILGRIREALRVKAPRPQAPGVVPGPANGAPPALRAREWLPRFGRTPGEHLAVFEMTCAALKADFHLVADESEMKQKLLHLKMTEQWKTMASHEGILTFLALQALNLPVCYTDKKYDPATLERCDVGVSECDALVAQTGSVLVTARSAGGRALSVLPPHHLILARRAQVVADLPEAFQLLKKKYGSNYPSFISFITGPSRTGDIERTLVVGAHGPKKVTIICLQG